MEDKKGKILYYVPPYKRGIKGDFICRAGL